MAKDIGKQAAYSVPYSLVPSIKASTSAKPTMRTIKKIQEQSQLRMDIKKYNSGVYFLTPRYILIHWL